MRVQPFMNCTLPYHTEPCPAMPCRALSCHHALHPGAEEATQRRSVVPTLGLWPDVSWRADRSVSRQCMASVRDSSTVRALVSSRPAAYPTYLVGYGFHLYARDPRLVSDTATMWHGATPTSPRTIVAGLPGGRGGLAPSPARTNGSL